MSNKIISLNEYEGTALSKCYIQKSEVTPDSILDRLNENFNKGLVDEDIYDKAVIQLDSLVEKGAPKKYFKREGVKGKYKYYYTEKEYKEAKGKSDVGDKTPTLDTFKKIAKESKDVKDFMSKVREIKNVPSSVSKEFQDKYGKDGASMEAASKNFMDEHKKGGEKEVKEVADFKPKIGDVVANTKTNTVGIVRNVFDDGGGDVRTDADGVVSIDDLEKYDPKKHGDYQIAPSTKKEIGGDKKSGKESGEDDDKPEIGSDNDAVNWVKDKAKGKSSSTTFIYGSSAYDIIKLVNAGVNDKSLALVKKWDKPRVRAAEKAIEKIKEERKSGGDIKKSLEDNLDILKSDDVSYSFNSDNITFDKKGKDLKLKVAVKKAVIEERLKEAEKELKKVRETLVKDGIKFVKDEYEEDMDSPVYTYDDDSMKKDSSVEGKTIMQCINRYHNLSWKLRRLKEDIAALVILEENFEDNKSYKVTTRQLQSLEKSEEIDIEKGRAVPVGTVSNGKQKQADGTWKPVKKDGKAKKKDGKGGGDKERKAGLKAAHAKMDVAQDKIEAANRKIEYHQGSPNKMAHKQQLKQEKINLKEAKKERTAAMKEAGKYIKKSEDNDTISFNENIDILKSESAAYAFGSSTTIFKKKGKDLKAKAAIKKAALEERMISAKKEATALKKVLEGHSIKFSKNENGYDRPIYNYNDEELKNASSIDGKTVYQCISEYQSLMYRCERIQSEIDALNILEENFEDNKTYDVNMRQLQSLEKSEDVDILSED